MTQPRVAPGTGTTPGEERDGARRAFLSAVHRVAPACVEELRSLPALPMAAWVPSPDAVCAWTQRWGLSAPWLHEAAATYYEEYVSCPPQWRDMSQWGDRGAQSVLEVQPPSWRVNWDTPAMYRGRIESFIRGIEAQIAAGTLLIDGVPVIAPRRRDPVSFDRLVKYQLLGQSAGQIAREDGLAGDRAHQDVMDSVEELAALIDLTLRAPSAGGRPRD